MNEFMTALLHEPIFYITVIITSVYCVIRDHTAHKRKRPQIDKLDLFLDFMNRTIFGAILKFMLVMVLVPIDIITHRMK